MAAPMKGIWANRFAQPYSGAAVWGTGINDVHSYYGSAPARELPVRPMEGMPQEKHDTTPPHEASSSSTNLDYLYGYPGGGEHGALDWDARPSWDVPTTENPSRFSTGDQPPYNATGAEKNRFRDTFAGVRIWWRGKTPRANYGQPSETVSEGWRNKPKGEPANAKPSDPSQYEMQTSMQQRYRTRHNRAAVARMTDEPRATIGSRVVGQRLKIYSGGERHYDMFPQQQSPDTERDFYFRTAGTGQPAWMENNQQWDINAVERTPPPDPYIGTPDTSDQLQFGYTQEDYFYA